MEELLYINDILIELPVSKVALTLQVNDIAEIQDRNAHYTNNIKIPKTPNNIATFAMLGIVGNSTRIPYESVDVKYVVNGIELIVKGKGIVKNTNTFFNLVTYDGNISLSELLGDKQMKSLDFSSYNHTLTSLAFTDSFTNTEGYIYALGKFYANDVSSIITTDLTSPSFYMHTLWDMIFEEKGWTTTGAFLSDTDFKSRLISMNNGYDRFATDNKTLKLTKNVGSSFSDTYAINTFDTFLLDSYTAVTSVTHLINLSGELIVTSGTGLEVVFYVNGTYIVSKQIESAGDLVLDYSIQLSSGDLLEVYIGAFSEDVLGTETIDIDVLWTETITENDLAIDIDFAKLIGDMKQIDFVKDIMQRFGLMFRKTPIDNNFEFETIQNILKDKAGAEDWSSKYSNFLDEKYKPNYAQVNFLKYKYNDNPDANTDLTFADGEIVLDNLNLKPTKTLLTSQFKASELNKTGYWTLNHWVFNDDIIEINEDGLGIFKKIDTAGDFKYRFSTSVDGYSNFTGTIPILNFDSIYYQKEVDNYYLEFESMLSDYKFVTLNLNLSLIDIFNLDFFKLKYFEQLGQYYYINKVSNYKKGALTKVELIQLGEDVPVALAMTSTTTGESVVSSTLSKNLAGEMSGYSAGCSVVSSTLSKTGVVLTGFQTSTNGTTIALVCSKSLDITRYHDGVGSLPVDTDIIYNDIGGTSLFNGGTNYYRSGATEIIKISTIGVVSNQADIC